MVNRSTVGSTGLAALGVTMRGRYRIVVDDYLNGWVWESVDGDGQEDANDDYRNHGSR
jgi:hypothetical protein